MTAINRQKLCATNQSSRLKKAPSTKGQGRAYLWLEALDKLAGRILNSWFPSSAKVGAARWVRLELVELEGRLTPSVTTLAAFDGTNGAYPSSLVMDSGGNLYGIADSASQAPPDTIFELANGSGTITTLATFGPSDGPQHLVIDNSGNLYGFDVTNIFELPKGSSTITTVATFDGANGDSPRSLVTDNSGNLYGTTFLGGSANLGTVFELAQGSGTISTLATFASDTSYGYYPNLLVIDENGNLYGTTSSGGPNGGGTAFEMVKGSNNIDILASLPLSDIVTVIAPDNSGNLYGILEGVPVVLAAS
jgi:uncharacterized repeat protein (TIGR03803 family)